MTAEEWQRLRKTPGMTLYFRLQNGHPISGTVVGLIARGATLSVREIRKDGSEISEETYQPYQCLYAERPEEAEEKKEGPYRKRCKCCGRYFMTRNKLRKFCCEQCQKYYFAKGEMPKERIIKTCPVCGKKFPVTAKSQGQIYCSRKCQGEGLSRRWKHAEL